MCDGTPDKRGRWKGWLDIPAPTPAPGGAPWQDLSFPVGEGLSRSPGFPEPRFRKLMSIPEDPANLTEMQMVCHFGTHIDAPLHFVADGPACHEIPLDRLYGQGVLWSLDVGINGFIEPRHLEAARPRMKPGDIVILDTGWTGHVNTDAYFDHPSLTAEAAEWLVANGAKMLAVDTLTPDLPGRHRPQGFEWPVHHILLEVGVLIGELVRIAPDLRGHRVEAMFAAVNIEGSDGAPVRAMARAID